MKKDDLWCEYCGKQEFNHTEKGEHDEEMRGLYDLMKDLKDNSTQGRKYGNYNQELGSKFCYLQIRLSSYLSANEMVIESEKYRTGIELNLAQF